MKLAFYFTLTCTARCAHCITHAGPQIRRKMSLSQALEVVDQATRTEGIHGLVFTGGENFVHADELLELVQACTARGLESEVISNAFWAKDKQAALEMLAPFRAAGLGVLRISIDRWHLPYVPIERVHHALDAMAELGFERHLTCVVDQENAVYKQPKPLALDAVELPRVGRDSLYTRELLGRMNAHWPPDLLRLLTTYGLDSADCLLIDDAIAFREQEPSWPGAEAAAERLVASSRLIQYQFLATEGRGRTLLGSVPDKHIEDIAETVCNSVGFSPVVNPEGDFFPCCSSWVNFPDHSLGNLREATVDELMARIDRDPFATFMHHQGPAVLVKYLRSKGIEIGAGADERPPVPADAAAPDVKLVRLRRSRGPLPERYTHPCHACGSLLERYSRQELEQHISSYYEENAWRRIFTSRGLNVLDMRTATGPQS